jgi:hypothetical protein
MLLDASVATDFFLIAQFRAHWGCQAERAEAGGDSFWGAWSGRMHRNCPFDLNIKMHYSPRMGPEIGPELRLIFLSLPLCRPQGACGGRPASH